MDANLLIALMRVHHGLEPISEAAAAASVVARVEAAVDQALLECEIAPGVTPGEFDRLLMALAQPQTAGSA